jgi:UDP-N-acetylmuramoylalanine--D-glutamate ligase
LKSALRGKRVAVYGLGKSGLSACRLLLREGAQVVAIDARMPGEIPEAAELNVRLFREGDVARALEGVELLVVSPGVPLSKPELQAARDGGVTVWGEVELASQLLPEGPLLGITGTNGKSTTTALTGEIFSRSGKRTFVGGNLGRPLTDAALDDRPFGAYVVELSSYQLEGIVETRLRGAALLNLTPDHLDRYESFQAYGAAKARIFLNQKDGDFAVVNADCPDTLRLAQGAKVPVYGFTMTGKPASSGIALAGLAVAKGEGFSFTFERGKPYLVQTPSLRGAHNLQNAMAAALLARLSGLSPDEIQAGISQYPGLPHRLERVRLLDGVEWVNDSKATNVESTLVALKAFEGERVWLIAGGKGKGAPYLPLVEASKGRVKGVLTVGQDALAIEAAFRGGFGVHPCETLERAVEAARGLATDGDVVLLSPACASLDQFKNFEHRGETFRALVRALS